MVYKGSCMCGEVQFQLDAEPVLQAICHCTDCQHEGGSFSASGVFPPNSLKYTAGKPARYDQKGSSGKNVEHYFCGKCGSKLVVMQAVLEGLVVVRVGSFTGEGNSGNEWFKPQVEYWIKSRQKWLSDFPELKQAQKNENV